MTMAATVFGRLESTNRLVVDAKALASEIGMQTKTFRAAADAIARGELYEADGLLQRIEDTVTQQDILRHIRDARQLIFALQEEWSQ